MAKGFKHGSVGGGSDGSGASLTIVGGTTRPAKPTQNMIWIDTDVEITNYALSATEPENPAEGMVWITIGNSSNVKTVSPVSDEWITVYPLSASQYVGDVWAGKTAMSYQFGEWVDWWDGATLFSKGNQFTRVTGGWVDAEQINASYAQRIPIEIGVSIELNPAVSSGYRQCVAVTKNKIDTTGFTAVDVNISNFVQDGHNFVLWILSTVSANAWGIVAQKDLANGKNSISITPGNYYIAIGFVTTQGGGGYAEIKEVRLAK